MLFSDLKGRKLVSTTTADTVGKVDGFLLDPAAKAVAGLTFKKTPQGSVVPWADLTAVGADAVTLADATLVLEPEHESLAGPGGLAELADKARHVLKKRVLTQAGEDLGPVGDIDFDPTTGALVSLLLKGGGTVPGEQLLGVGSYAVVVSGPGAGS